MLSFQKVKQASQCSLKLFNDEIMFSFGKVRSNTIFRIFKIFCFEITLSFGKIGLKQFSKWSLNLSTLK